jgi:hypothetical protein
MSKNHSNTNKNIKFSMVRKVFVNTLKILAKTIKILAIAIKNIFKGFWWLVSPAKPHEINKKRAKRILKNVARMSRRR